MSTIMQPVRGKSWVFQVTALCIVLGALLALSLKTQRQAVDTGEINRFPAIAARFRDVKQQNADLTNALRKANEKNTRLARLRASGTSSSQDLEKELTDAQMMAGSLPLHGPGVTVTVHDSPKLDKSETREDIIRQFLVHDSDLWGIVNTLFSAKAEAISVNDERLVGNSSIKCAGSIILVNQEEVAAPFVIKAIGRPDRLISALDMRGGTVDGLFMLDMIEIRKERDVAVPAYTGPPRINLARPSETGSARAGME